MASIFKILILCVVICFWGIKNLNAQSDSISIPYIPMDSSFNQSVENTENQLDSFENQPSERNYEPKNYLSKEYAASKIEVRPFDTAEWRHLTQNLKYKEDSQKAQKRTKPDASKGNFTFSQEFKNLVKIFLGIALIAGLITLLIFIAQRGGFSNLFQKNKKLLSSEQILDYQNIDESNIVNNDFPSLIQAALRDENYLMALRLNYLYALKSLEEVNLIHWQRDKTNGSYLRELAPQSAIQTPFKKLTRQFEFYFYGKYPLNVQQYKSIELEFTDFTRSVQLLKSMATNSTLNSK